jgi:hypothetical protein
VWQASRALAEARRADSDPAAALRGHYAAVLQEAQSYCRCSLLTGGEAYWLALLHAAAAATAETSVPAGQRSSRADHAAAAAVAWLDRARAIGYFCCPDARAWRRTSSWTCSGPAPTSAAYEK